MSTCISVKNYIDDKIFKDLSIPSTLFIKPNYYDQKISKLGNIDNFIIDDEIYDILINNVSINDKINKQPKTTRKSKVKFNKKNKSRKKN